MSLDADAEIVETSIVPVAKDVEKAPASVGHNLGDVIVNIRFHPDGTVNTINNRPDHIAAQEWFHRLCKAAPQHFRTLAGGRGHFQIPFETFSAIVSQNAA